MKIIIVTSLVFFATCMAHARPMNVLSYQELYDKADLVIIAKPVSTQVTDEKTMLTENITPGVPVVGVSTKFEISVVMKGDKSLKNITMHHYRLADPNVIYANGPLLISFDSKNAYDSNAANLISSGSKQQQDTRFLLFLRLESDGRYAPVSGQTDPAGVSVFKMDGLAR